LGDGKRWGIETGKGNGIEKQKRRKGKVKRREMGEGEWES